MKLLNSCGGAGSVAFVLLGLVIFATAAPQPPRVPPADLGPVAGQALLDITPADDGGTTTPTEDFEEPAPEEFTPESEIPDGPASEWGDDHPYITVDGIGLRYEPASGWYRHLGTNAPKAYWIAVGGEFLLLKTEREVNDKQRPIIQEWDPRKRGWVDTDRVRENYADSLKEATEVVIEAPEEVGGGELVTLTAVVPTGAHHLWLYDPEYDFKTAACGGTDAAKNTDTRTLVFATPRPGSYRFWFVHSDPATGTLGKATVVIKVGSGGGVPPSDPLPPTAPPTADPLVKALEQLYDAVLARTAELKDSPTATALAAAFTAVAPDIMKATKLEQCGSLLSARFETVMLARGPPSRDKDWEGQFRRPLNQAIDDLVKAGILKNPADYAAVVRVVAAALEAR